MTPDAAHQLESSMRLLHEHLDKLSLGGNHPTMVVVPRASVTRLLEAMETVRGDVYLWKLGETTHETAMGGVADAVGG